MYYTNALDSALTAVLSTFFTFIPTGMVSIAAYVLTSLSLYTVAVRRRIPNPWLSWIPVVRVWILGSLSDQYRYVVKGQYKSKRKILIGLEIAGGLLTVFFVGQIVYSVMQMVAYYNANPSGILSLVLGNLATIIALVVIGVAGTVVRYMALYDVYISMDPENGVLFLVLSIFFRITEPFFLFFNREKDKGMPPRRQTAPENE